MGGAVGLKGTDGLAEEARRRGARPLAPARAIACLRRLAPEAGRLLLLVPTGEMGEASIRQCNLSYEVVFYAPEETGAEHTRSACREFLRHGVELILFCGGDGTARDVASAAGNMPVLGIPAGVKMHSGVFAVSPEAAAELTLRFLKGELRTRETEVVDVDEELYRSGVLSIRLYATARTPYAPVLVQEKKQVYSSGDEEESKGGIALFAKEFMRDGSAYILGAGTTTAAIARLLGIEKTLLGVDVIQDGRLILRDASEQAILASLEGARSAKIIVSPIGAQGFILGRGSQQISPEVLKRVGTKNLIVVATPHKLRDTPRLLVDTGDPELDRTLSGSRQVVCGYRLAQLVDVRSAGDVD
jgi:predicted polyphosphate/ATP-dependent NAD kinase